MNDVRSAKTLLSTLLLLFHSLVQQLKRSGSYPNFGHSNCQNFLFIKQNNNFKKCTLVEARTVNLRHTEHPIFSLYYQELNQKQKNCKWSVKCGPLYIKSNGPLHRQKQPELISSLSTYFLMHALEKTAATFLITKR